MELAIVAAGYLVLWWILRRPWVSPPTDGPSSAIRLQCSPDRWRREPDPDPDVLQMYVGKGAGDCYRVAFGAHEVTGDELYILVCDDQHACDLIDRAADWAADPELSFGEDDFMRVQRQMGTAKI